MTLGERVKAKRAAENLTLQQVADATGLGLSTVWAVENHPGRAATLRVMKKLALWLNISIEELVAS